MSGPKQLRFNAFNMTAPSHNWAGLWAHLRDTSTNYNSLEYDQLAAATDPRAAYLRCVPIENRDA
jgi:hypothetical protein